MKQLLACGTLLACVVHQAALGQPGGGESRSIPAVSAEGSGAGAAATTAAPAKVYAVRRASGPIKIDGRIEEAAWSAAVVERGFTFPWKAAPAPPTEFRALWDDRNLYFAFEVEDSDLVVLDRLGDEEDAVLEDRVEFYFAPDQGLRDYYCLEIDPKGRRFDYRGAYYRKLKPEWNLAGMEAAGQIWGKTSPRPGKTGYTIEGRIELSALVQMGFPPVTAGARLRTGVFRAEFSHDRSGKTAAKPSLHTRGRSAGGPPPIEEWISWVDPRTAEPDFHVPSAFGFLEFVR